MIVALVVIIVVIAGIGWIYRPGTTAYPVVPHGMVISVTGEVKGLTLELTRQPDRSATLVIYDDGLIDYTKGVTPGGWSIQYSGAGPATVCNPSTGTIPIPPHTSAFDSTPLQIPKVTHGPAVALPDTYVAPGTVRVAPVSRAAGLYLRLCWSSDAPIALNGAYLSAQLPTVQVGNGSASGGVAVPVTESVVANAGDTSTYSVQTNASLTSSDADSWTWATQAVPTPVSFESSVAPISLSAVDVAKTQHQASQEFFAGVLLGVAGGAVITLVMELVPDRRRGSTAESDD